MSQGELPEDEVETEKLAPEASSRPLRLDGFGGCISTDCTGFTHRTGWARVAWDTDFCGGLLRILGRNNRLGEGSVSVKGLLEGLRFFFFFLLDWFSDSWLLFSSCRRLGQGVHGLLMARNPPIIMISRSKLVKRDEQSCAKSPINVVNEINGKV